MTLDVKVGCIILRVKEVLPSGLLLLEGKDKDCCEQSKSCAQCHLSIEGTVHPELAVVPEGLPCFVFGEKEVATMIFVINVKVVGTWHG